MPFIIKLRHKTAPCGSPLYKSDKCKKTWVTTKLEDAKVFEKVRTAEVLYGRASKKPEFEEYIRNGGNRWRYNKTLYNYDFSDYEAIEVQTYYSITPVN